MNVEIPDAGKYTQVLCPLPVVGRRKCGADLYWAWEVSLPVYVGDLTGGPVPTPLDAYSGSWHVECVEGHRVMVPRPIGEVCKHRDDEDCPGHDEDSDEAMRTVRPSDVVRLRRFLAEIGPCVDLAGVAQIVTRVPDGTGAAAAGDTPARVTRRGPL